MSVIKTTVNAPDYEPKIKHQTIFAAYNGLEPGETMLLVNDHDPIPLRYQFEAMHPGEFTWTYTEEGPDTWQVVIEKTK